MPVKFPKELTTHLFRYVRNVDIKFNPFDSRTRSARELLRQVQADRYKKANPKLEVKSSVLSTPDAPSVAFKFIDGTEHSFDSQEYNCKEMMEQVYFRAMEIDTEFEKAGKSPDDI